MAVLPQFIPADAQALSAGVLLALVHVVESVIWFSVLIWGTRLMKSWLERPAVKVWLDRITGGVLVGFGIKVALTR
jgi:threonine/homoserine/homoserine lactone efflux protein